MNYFSKENSDRWFNLAWWLCVVTLPWLDMLNNICLIFLTVLWLADKGIVKRWSQLKTTAWVRPFLLYYLVLVVGLIYTTDIDNGLFTLDKKITFILLPLIATTGRTINKEVFDFLKRSFVYSCTLVIFVCLVLSSADYFSGNATPYNFDLGAEAAFNEMHPGASSIWMHFSYVQLARSAGLHPAYFSMYLVFCLVIIFTDDLFVAKRRLSIFIGILMISFIALLSTRMAVIALVFSMVYLGVKKFRTKGINASLVIASVILILGFFLWLNPVARYRVVEEPLLTKYKADTTVTNWNSVSYRLLEWTGSWSIIKKNLFTGAGTGSWQAGMNNFYSHYNSSTVGLEHNAHNQFLQTWMENGLPGLIAFLFCLTPFIVFRKNTEASHGAFILIFSLMCLTESIGERQKGVVFFTLFQSLFSAFETKTI